MIPNPSEAQVTQRLREASDLTRLCLALPRMATPGEERALLALQAWLNGSAEAPTGKQLRAAMSVLWARKELEPIVAAGDRLGAQAVAADDRIDTYVCHSKELLGRTPQRGE